MDTKPRATFHAMADGTKADWDIIADEALHAAVGLPDRIIAHLQLLRGDHGGFAVDRLEHSLQTATRAERAGRDDEYVFCALLHDIGDILGSFNHADIATAVVSPFVTDENLWMVEQHAVFQGYYFFHHLGLDRDLRDQYLGHPSYDRTAEFCAEYDQPAFDPNYDSNPLEHYEPLLRSIMASPRRSIYKRAGGDAFVTT